MVWKSLIVTPELSIFYKPHYDSQIKRMSIAPEKFEQLKALDTKFHKTLLDNPKNYTYGTSGFRYPAEYMYPICIRVGLFMDILAKYYYPHALGIVITASHNPKGDNGLKLVSPEGEMLDWKFESIMDTFINTVDLETGRNKMIESIKAEFGGKEPGPNGLIFVARDTRDSGPEIQGLMSNPDYISNKFVDFGKLATPVLYFMVWEYNEHHDKYKEMDDATLTKTLLELYLKKIKDGFAYHNKRYHKTKKFNLIIDTSNGVGSLMIEKFRDSDLFNIYNPTLIYNNDFENLNVDCGAEYVHRYSKPTAKFLALPEKDGLINVCMVADGDADRNIFYVRKEKDSTEIKLGDGNRICALYARVLAYFKNEMLNKKDQYDASVFEALSKSKVGIIYTAYSNMAYVDYARQVLKLETEIAKTGVKFSHAKAKLYDIGIYFESNGHGTIIFKKSTIELLDKAISTAKTPEAKLLAEDFKMYLTGQNNINGDALGNFMLILASLDILNIELDEVFTCYTDNRSLTGKVPLKDRTLMKSTDDERILAQPADLQPQVTQLMSEYPGYIGFVRGSGTEDLCRIYVEGRDEVVLKEIEARLRKLVSEHPLLRFK